MKQEELVSVGPSNEYSRDKGALVTGGMPTNSSLSVAEGIAEESDVQDMKQGDNLLAYIDNQLEYMDHRIKGGSLWGDW
ncbi:hypothetical protein [Halobacillus hunanensis]|uniref:hypothetical protein n=1 Tax=Halobacillus hunanensis TaxID=578214 RepID=UPI0009A596BC|nr:hypothetical protein [Halobacillus hunanensis]